MRTNIESQPALLALVNPQGPKADNPCRIPIKVFAIASVLAALCAPRGLAQLPPAGYALAFNGTNQSVSFNLVLTATDNFTIEAWVNPATTTGNHAIAYNGNTSYNGWGIYQFGNAFQVLYGGISIWGSSPATPNVWQHVALARSGGTAILYVNGVEVGLNNSYGPNSATGTFAIRSTPQALTEVFDGQIDEVRVWSVGLTAAQVRTLRRVSVPGNTAGLFTEFHFDEGTGNLTANNTAVGGQAALINGPAWVLSGVPYGPTTTTVASLADDGSPGTLRYAISDALPGDNLSLTGNGTLSLNSTLGSLVLTQNVVITGPGASTMAISGSNKVSLFQVQSNVTVSITGLTIENGYAGDGAAGVSKTAGKAGNAGGGIYNLGNLSLGNCLFSNNVAGKGGGGYAAVSVSDPATDGGAGGSGGAIYNASGSLNLSGCTLTANAAGNGAAGGAGAGFSGCRGGRSGRGGDGGAIYSRGTLTLTNCTLAYNSAGNGAGGGSLVVLLDSSGVAGEGGSGGWGGGIYSANSALLVSCTVSGNNAGNAGAGGAGATSTGGNGGNAGNGGGLFAAAGMPALRNCIVAANSSGKAGAGGSGYVLPGSAGAPGFAPDLAGSFSSQGRNLVGQPAGASGFARGQNSDLLGDPSAPLVPGLAPLQQNGGPTPTMALLPSSPAIDAGDDALAGFDQRGFARPSGAHVDIGAFEFDLSSSLPPVLTGISLGAIIKDPATLLASTAVAATLQPTPYPTTVYLQYGPTNNYGSATAPMLLSPTNLALALSLPLTGLSPGLTWHIRIVASNAGGTTYGPDLSVSLPSLYWPGDLDGDGIVSQGELNVVLSNYWTHSPWVQMTNTAGLGTTNVQFALTNASAWLFTVEASTNLNDWTTIGSASPLYQFSDPAATNSPQRFYRLRWP